MIGKPENPSKRLDQMIEAERLSAPSEASRQANWAGVEALRSAPVGAGGGALVKLVSLAVLIGIGGALVGGALSTPDERRDDTPEAGASDVVVEDEPGPAVKRGAEDLRASLGATESRSAQNEGTSVDGGPQEELRPVEGEQGEGWDAELRLLQRAEAALRDDRAEEAIELAEEYRRRWPAGEFVEAVDAAGTLARCRLGDHDDARQARADYERAWPRSLYTERIRKGCVGDPP
jgi:hypothetical protein